MITISFFGHRNIYNPTLREKLHDCVKKFLVKDKVRLLIGTHGDFDLLSLSVCRELKSIFDCKIYLVFTSLAALNKFDKELYKDVETLMYEIEDEHYKKQITICNQKMINDSDFIICYVNMLKYQSGAKLAITYAKKKNKKIINLYEDNKNINTLY